MEPRLKTAIRIAALLRRYDQVAIPCLVVRRGDGDAGAVLIKFNRLADDCTVFAQERDGDGRLIWQAVSGDAVVSEAAADAYIARQLKRDPDLWVLEIEDRQDRQFFRDGF